jgi:hypothetical protein
VLNGDLTLGLARVESDLRASVAAAVGCGSRSAGEDVDFMERHRAGTC